MNKKHKKNIKNMFYGYIKIVADSRGTVGAAAPYWLTFIYQKTAFSV